MSLYPLAKVERGFWKIRQGYLDVSGDVIDDKGIAVMYLIAITLLALVLLVSLAASGMFILSIISFTTAM